MFFIELFSVSTIEPSLSSSAPFIDFIFCLLLRYAQELANIKCLVGVETEFILLSSTDPITAVNHHGWCDTLKTPSGSIEAKVMREIADNLQKAGVDLEMYHAEATPGQVSVITQTVQH